MMFLTVATQGGSNVVSGSGLSHNQPEDEAKKIHQENADKLAAMTQEEILKEQQKLMDSLGKYLKCAYR